MNVTALDRLRSDPYQFYASAILGLPELRPLDAEPDAAWQGTLAHRILEDWHKGKGTPEALAAQHLAAMHAHPLVRALWKPRLLKALDWVAQQIGAMTERTPAIIEQKGEMLVKGVTIRGKADRIDRMADGTMAVVDYKTGKPPSGKQADTRGHAQQFDNAHNLLPLTGLAELAACSFARRGSRQDRRQ